MKQSKVKERNTSPFVHREHAQDGNGRARQHDHVVRKGKSTRCALPDKYSSRHHCRPHHKFRAQPHIPETRHERRENTWRPPESVHHKPCHTAHEQQKTSSCEGFPQLDWIAWSLECWQVASMELAKRRNQEARISNRDIYVQLGPVRTELVHCHSTAASAPTALR